MRRVVERGLQTNLLKCLQVNLHKAKAASDVLSNRFIKEKFQVALIQEPWINNGKVRGIPSGLGNLVYDHNCLRARAALVLHPHIKYLPIPQLITADLVAVSMETNANGGIQEVVIASAYFPGEEDSAPPEDVKKLVDYCKTNNKQFIVSCDANAHHEVWGSSDTNIRGEYLYDFLLINSINILNKGIEPTFVTANRQEVLDLTLSSQYACTIVRNWHVSSEASLSDHRHIVYELMAPMAKQETYRNPKLTDWELYKETLRTGIADCNKATESIDDIDLNCENLSCLISHAYENSCPVKHKKEMRQVPWWNRELNNLRSLARKLFNKAKNNGQWEVYRTALTKYNKALRKSKRETWKSFCEGVEQTPTVARLQKVLSKDHSNGIGYLAKPDGSYTRSGKETAVTLLETHFPGCQILSNANDGTNEERVVRPALGSRILANKIFHPERVKWAIRAFKPYKAPGGDGIIPAMIQKGMEIIQEHLVEIFKASFKWSYIPKQWRKTTVVFIPKAGNRPTDQPKSFRPISLASFFLKMMEKVIDQYIRNELDIKVHLHVNQHAYQKGKSTETALHNLVKKIERAIETKGIALCSFIDIEGAFDNTPHMSIERAASRKGLEPSIIQWIKSMLANRTVTAKILGESTTAITSRGCPQGGVLSPLLWSIVVDELLEILTNNGLEVIGYADDIAIMVRGNDDQIISDRMQEALNLIQEWCCDNNLGINPNKIVIVPFTNRRKLDFKTLALRGRTIELEKTVKYLGIYLDQKLTWNQQLENIRTKAIRALWTCSMLYGKTWGLKPQMIHWTYTMIIRPMITYAALVWWPKTKQKQAQNVLNNIQRRTCLGITGAMHTCPTVALEALTGLTPLHLQVKKEAALSALRLQSQKHFKSGDLTGHLEILSMKEIEKVNMLPKDDMPLTYNFDINFKVDIREREGWTLNNLNLKRGSITWYTDGSKTNLGTGAGVKGPREKLSFPMGMKATVFQAEIYAINMCIQKILEKGTRGAHITILSDSQAAIKALTSHEQRSKLVWCCLQDLISLARCNRVTITWVPGHEGIEGNEAADELAKAGSETPFVGPEPFCGIHKNHKKNIIEQWIYKEHYNYYLNVQGLETSKKFISLSRKRANKLICLNKSDIKLITGMLTGHCSLRYHLHKLGLAEDNICRHCNEEEEKTEHVLCECPALYRKRQKFFGKDYVSPNEIKELDIGKLLEYIKCLTTLQ